MARSPALPGLSVADAHGNFAVSAVVTAPSPATSGTTLTVNAGEGALFPATPFNAVAMPGWMPPSSMPGFREVVRVTGISTDSLTIVRAQEGSAACSIASGWIIDASTPTAKAFTDLETCIATGWTPDANAWTVHVPPTQASMTTVVAASTVGHSGLTFANGDAVIASGFVLTIALVTLNGALLYIVNQTSTTVQLSLTPGGSAIAFAGSADTTAVTLTGWNQFTVPVDASGYLAPGTKISWNDATNTPGYGVVAQAVNNSGTTTVTPIYNSDYPMANHAFTAPRYSYASVPQAFPAAFNWTPTLVGWGGSPPTTAMYRWSADGRRITLFIRQGTATTSTGTTHTASLPVGAALAAAVTNGQWANTCRAIDATTTIGTGWLLISSSTTSVSLAGLIATISNTASGTSSVTGQITYEF